MLEKLLETNGTFVYSWQLFCQFFGVGTRAFEEWTFAATSVNVHLRFTGSFLILLWEEEVEMFVLWKYEINKVLECVNTSLWTSVCVVKTRVGKLQYAVLRLLLEKCFSLIIVCVMASGDVCTWHSNREKHSGFSKQHVHQQNHHRRRPQVIRLSYLFCVIYCYYLIWRKR